LEGDHVFALPYASCLSTFQAPEWRIPAVFSPHRWRNATQWELVPFSHRSASRIFIMQPGCIPPPAVTQDGDLQFDGGGKRAGLRPLPTTGIWLFAECHILCRVFYFGHSAKSSLPSATQKTLGKRKHSTKKLFAECFIFDTRQKVSLPSVFF
jgi:hypothetical protein